MHPITLLIPAQRPLDHQELWFHVASDDPPEYALRMYVTKSPHRPQLTAPFAVLQTCVILASAWAAMRWKSKGIFIVVLMVPCCVGSGLLYGKQLPA
jgi:hypothetical protein